MNGNTPITIPGINGLLGREKPEPPQPQVEVNAEAEPQSPTLDQQRKERLSRAVLALAPSVFNMNVPMLGSIVLSVAAIFLVGAGGIDYLFTAVRILLIAVLIFLGLGFKGGKASLVIFAIDLLLSGACAIFLVSLFLFVTTKGKA